MFDLHQVRLLDGPFKDAQERDHKYLLELDADRLLHAFRVTAGLPSTAQPLGGWEAPDGELRGEWAGQATARETNPQVARSPAYWGHCGCIDCLKRDGGTRWTDLKTREKWNASLNPSSAATAWIECPPSSSSRAACPIRRRVRNR